MGKIGTANFIILILTVHQTKHTRSQNMDWFVKLLVQHLSCSTESPLIDQVFRMTVWSNSRKVMCAIEIGITYYLASPLLYDVSFLEQRVEDG